MPTSQSSCQDRNTTSIFRDFISKCAAPLVSVCQNIEKGIKKCCCHFSALRAAPFLTKVLFYLFLKVKRCAEESFLLFFFIFKLQFLKNCYFVFRPRKLVTLKPFLLDLIVISSTKQKKLAIKVNVWKLSCKKKRFTVRKFILITYLVRFRIMMMMMNPSH